MSVCACVCVSVRVRVHLCVCICVHVTAHVCVRACVRVFASCTACLGVLTTSLVPCLALSNGAVPRAKIRCVHCCIPEECAQGL